LNPPANPALALICCRKMKLSLILRQIKAPAVGRQEAAKGHTK